MKALERLLLRETGRVKPVRVALGTLERDDVSPMQRPHASAKQHVAELTIRMEFWENTAEKGSFERQLETVKRAMSRCLYADVIDGLLAIQVAARGGDARGTAEMVEELIQELSG